MPVEKYFLSSDYNIMSRRIKKLDIKIKERGSKEFKDDCIVIAIYSTGIGCK
jgi:hypothetical protein